MVFVVHAFSLPLEALDVCLSEHLSELVKALADSTGLVAERCVERDSQFFLILQKLFSAFQRLRVFPLQRRTHRNVRIEQRWFRNHRVDRKQPAERMSCENAIRLDAIILFDLRNQLRLEELEKVVCSARGRKLQHTRSVL